jgi:hypothetical protein
MTDRAERYHSPDGELTLVVLSEADDVSIGFDGFEWQTHGDLLAADYPSEAGSRLTAESAARRLVEDIVTNRAIIVVRRVDGEIRDVWITDDVQEELRDQQPGETMEFRYWDGSPAYQGR